MIIQFMKYIIMVHDKLYIVVYYLPMYNVLSFQYQKLYIHNKILSEMEESNKVLPNFYLDVEFGDNRLMIANFELWQTIVAQLNSVQSNIFIIIHAYSMEDSISPCRSTSAKIISIKHLTTTNYSNKLTLYRNHWTPIQICM